MPKKSLVQNSQTKQSLSMPPPHSYTVNAPAGLALTCEEDDDDDICPVCESECTCHNRVNPPSSSKNIAPTPTSTSTSTTSSHPRHSQPPVPSLPPSLKIKLTVPPSIKFRKENTIASHVAPIAHPGRAPLLSHHAADTTGSKRRGRPPKAVVAAREASKAALAANHSAAANRSRAPPLRSPFTLASTPAVVLKSKRQPLNKKTLSKLSGKKKSHGRGATVQTASSLSSLSESDEGVQFPTFMSAASSSFLTSSSESSEINSDDLSSSDSDLEEEEHFILQNQRDKARVKKEIYGDESSQKHRNDAPGNRWEIKPRKKSVGAGESDSEVESEESSEEEEEADDEDDGDADEDDVAMEADAEEVEVAEADTYKDLDRDDDDGKLGVSFAGLPSGWSDDEESSFDAELFFANLDDSSDSDVSPAALRNDDFAAENDQFSGDEDALLLMDVDPSAQTRRTHGGFVGVDIDGLSLALDDGLVPSPFGPFDNNMSFDGSTESDIEMTTDQKYDTDDDSDELALVETDGETTEDELVDSDGLPNSRAMMMFRWPTSISTVDPQSTMSPGSMVLPAPATPAHTSQTLRIALASMSAQRGSPAPTPAEILAGKISMDDLDEIEISYDGHVDASRSSRSSSRRNGAPTMRQFPDTPVSGEGERHAIVDGSGSLIPSPFPHSRILRAKRRRALSLHQSATSLDMSADAEGRVLRTSSTTLPLVFANAISSDELGTQTLEQGSDEPPSTDAIDLDDVLDASMLDSEPTYDSDEPSIGPWATPKTPVTGSHARSLTRWDRIPVATFRRTRETPLLETTPASDNGVSGRFASIGALNNDMLGTPKQTTKSKASLKKRSKGKANANLLLISPILMPVRDGDRTPTNAGPLTYNPFQQQHDPLHQQRSRRDQRKDKALLKKKMMGKYASDSPNRPVQRHHRTHYPNMKSRASGSMQRTQFSASSSSHVPHFSL